MSKRIPHPLVDVSEREFARKIQVRKDDRLALYFVDLIMTRNSLKEGAMKGELMLHTLHLVVQRIQQVAKAEGEVLKGEWVFVSPLMLEVVPTVLSERHFGRVSWGLARAGTGLG